MSFAGLPRYAADARRICGKHEAKVFLAGLCHKDAALVEKCLQVCGVLPCPRPVASDYFRAVPAPARTSGAERERWARDNAAMRANAATLARALGPLPARSPTQVAYLWVDQPANEYPTLRAFTLDEGAEVSIPLALQQTGS